MDRTRRNGRGRARPPRLAAFPALLLAAALCLPCAQAHAIEIYHARAIGQEYLPEAPPPADPAEGERTMPAPELPRLGDGAPAEAPERPMSVWTRLLIGVALVAAVAALGDGDSGAAQLNVNPGGGDPGGAGTPPQGGADGGAAAEPLPGAGRGDDDPGFIDIGIGDRDFDLDFDDDDDRGRGRGRGRRGGGRDRD